MLVPISVTALGQDTAEINASFVSSTNFYLSFPFFLHLFKLVSLCHRMWPTTHFKSNRVICLLVYLLNRILKYKATS